MKITSAKLIICSPDRNFVTLRIDTDEGIYGLGDGHPQRPRTSCSQLPPGPHPPLPHRSRPFPDRRHLAVSLSRSLLAARPRHHVCYCRRRRRPSGTSKARPLNTPVYNLLGGKSREGCLVYCHANGADIPEALDSVRKHMAEGYLAVRAQAGGPRRSQQLRRPQSREALRASRARSSPPKASGRQSATSTSSPPSSKNFGAELGPDVHLLHDVHHRLTPIEAARLGKAFEPYHPLLDGRPLPRRTAGKLRTHPANTPLPLSPSAKSSTPSGTLTTSSATNSSTTSA